jgi:hypothetical protein
MNEQFVQRVRLAAHVAENPEASLLELLAELSGTSPEAGNAPRSIDQDVRLGARDTSSVSSSEGKQMIMISIGDLAELLQAVVTPPSFGEALIAEGFKPASGPAPSLRRGNRRYPLKRYRPDRHQTPSSILAIDF